MFRFTTLLCKLKPERICRSVDPFTWPQDLVLVSYNAIFFASLPRIWLRSLLETK